MKVLFKCLLVGFLFIVSFQNLSALEMSKIFNSNMVLQRNVKLPVWGTATPNEKITVTINNQQKSSITDKNGHWRVALQPMTAGGPFQLNIKSDAAKLSFSNVLIGDVWLCSGQSNMRYWVKNANNAKEEIKNANYPKIRLFFSTPRISITPAKTSMGKWYVCSSVNVPRFSAVGYYFGKTLYKKLNVPIGLINISRGGTPIVAWMSSEALKADPDFAKILERYQEALKTYPEKKTAYEKKYKVYRKRFANYVEFKKAVAEARKAGKKPPVKPYPPHLAPGGLWQPSGCYNANVSPLVTFGIKGVIWYQGEADVAIAYLYRKLHPALIKDWRKSWQQGEFPFILVQLPNYGKTFPQCRNNQWAELREAQYLTSKSVVNTGLAVTIDIGHAKMLHPTNKQDVGKRLAAWALTNVYKKNIPFLGPVYKSFKKNGDEIIIYFEDDKQDLISKDGKKLNAFQVAGSNKRFVWANARIDNNTVIVSSPKIKKPVAVRYGWEQSPKINLYNKHGFPAMPFRTDDWPGMTFNTR